MKYTIVYIKYNMSEPRTLEKDYSPCMKLLQIHLCSILLSLAGFEQDFFFFFNGGSFFNPFPPSTCHGDHFSQTN